MDVVTVTVVFAAAGSMIGLALAWISVRLPGSRPRSGAHWPLRLSAFALAAAAIGAWAGLSQASVSATLLTAILGWMLLLIAVVDAEHFWLPDELTLPLAAAGLGAALLPGDRAAERRDRRRDGLRRPLAAGVRLSAPEGTGRPGRRRSLPAGGGRRLGRMDRPADRAAVGGGGGLSLVLARALMKKPLAGDDRLAFGVFLAVGIWMTWLFGPLGL